jgi:hypothetical protein
MNETNSTPSQALYNKQIAAKLHEKGFNADFGEPIKVQYDCIDFSEQNQTVIDEARKKLES